MSYYLKIYRWSGQNQSNAAARLAKVFRMQDTRAEVILRGILKGEPWQFEHSVSAEQSERARIYLHKLGYQVELIPAFKTQSRQAFVASMPPPMEETPPRKSIFSFLKKGKTSSPEKAIPEPPPLSEKAPKSIFSFLKKGKTPPPEKAIPEPPPLSEKAPKSIFSFLKKGKTPPPEKAIPEPPALSEKAPPKKSIFSFMKKGTAAPRKTKAPPRQAESVLKPRKKSVAGKAALLFLLLLPVTVAALPYCFGMRAEAILNELVPQVFQKGTIVQLRNYDRGWLRSTAEYTVKTKGVPPLTVSSVIIHGPFSVDELMSGNFTGEYFQARIDSGIKLAGQGEAGVDPLEGVAKKGYFLKRGPVYKMDLVIKDEGLLVNGKLIPLPSSAK